MKPLPALLLATLTAGWSLSAAEPDLSKLPPPSDKTGLTFARDIRPLFEASCFNCHGERRQRAGLRLDSLEAVLQGSDDGKVVVPGNGKESLLVQAVAQIDDETAMPPKRQRGGFGGGPGGPGGPGGRGPGGTNGPGRGGFGGGFGGMFAGQWFEQADANKDQKITQAEFSDLGAKWFAKIDSKNAGKLTEQEFSSGLDGVLPVGPGGGGGPGGGRGFGSGGQRGGNEGMGFGVGRFLGSALFTGADANKDGSITSAELSGMFGKWFTDWDTNKTGSLTSAQFRDGLSGAMARANPGGRRGPGGPGGPGGGFGGGGFGMFGRQALAQQMVTQADTDKDGKLSKSEFTALSDAWFDKFDADKLGKVNQEKFTEKFADALGLPQPPAGQGRPTPPPTNPGGGPGRRGGNEGPGGRGPGGGGFGGPANLAPGVFSAADADKDGSLTRAELKSTFEKWFTEFDSSRSGSLNEESLYAGLREKLPQGGGFGGFGGFGGDQGPAPKALTAEQVGLVRAWIDQGAK